ncbi:hypothetical protein K505DRAFT_416161 [Melanomma pulvis-pyrius CBS 109.77]|uniref:Fungal N-terminal domain-containing protein n=1 Tax=Melanomma pulvis-pyrius CBS 109.77 TaxID=1314802 RepID=A0A6A6XI83_9PLEO|nr:hypothetical protein K505DRAFT_416161 [Melanomma pulvis-pyrius CBS 109.77]
MDPVSAACCAAQFIGLAGQALQGIISIRRRFQGVKSAPKLVKRIHHELKIIEGIVAQLSKLEQSQISDDAAQNFLATLMECEDTMQALGEVLIRHDFVNCEGGMKRLWKKILTDDKRPEFEEYLRILERAKTSLLVTMSGMQLHATSDFRRDFATHAHKVEQSLGNVELGISSLHNISKDIYSTTVETNMRVEEVVDVIKSVDRAIQDLRTDMPVLMEGGIQRILESQLEGWLKNIDVGHLSQGTSTITGNSSLLEHDSARVTTVNRTSSNSSIVLTRNTDFNHTSSLEPKFHYLPHHLSPGQSRNGTCVRKKTYSRNFPLPIGFIQMKTTQRIYQDTFTAGTSIQKETLRVEMTIIPFRWLSSRGQVLSFEKVYDEYHRHSWTYTPRTYNTVTDNAMIVLACQNQDLESVRNLFKYQKASPFDVSLDGRSLMAHTVQKFDIEGRASVIMKAKDVIQFLISQGADTTRFMKELLDSYAVLASNAMYRNFESSYVDDPTVNENLRLLDEIWRLCLERCQTDPFVNTSVLEQLWDRSLGGRDLPSLDGAYLFHNEYAGFDDLLFENPEKVFTDLMGAGLISWMADKTWERLTDQHYETLVHLCNGGNDSMKARLFSKPPPTATTWKENSCFCPSSRSHLLFKALLYNPPFDKKSRQRHRRRHLRRILVLLLESGEDPEATCSCKATWQRPEGFRSATDLAASVGAIEIWLAVLEEAGFDATRIFDECRFEGLSDLFDAPDEKSNSLTGPLKVVGSAIIRTISSIV